MSQDRGRPVAPPADLDRRAFEPARIEPGTKWWRIHRTTQGPCYFSKSPDNRFSSANLGVLYLADDPCTAFWEVYWDDLATRPPDQRRIAAVKLDERSYCRASLRREAAVFDATNQQSLLDVSAPGPTFSGDYDLCQKWAAALSAHPRAPQGIKYRSARRTGNVCLALFEPPFACRDLRFGASRPVGASKRILRELEAFDVSVVGA